MSSSVPPEPPPGGPEYLEPGPGGPSDAPDGAAAPGRGRRTAVLLGAGVGALALAGAGVWAATAFFADGAQPTEALPAATLAYVSVDVDPSGEQQLEALRTLEKFPLFTDEMDLTEGDDVREWVFRAIQEDGNCPDLDYAADVEPWLGTSAAVAAVDLGDGPPTPVVVLGLEDASAAEEGLDGLFSCAGEDEQAGWEILGDWAVIAETEGEAGDIAAAAEESALSDNADHERWLGEVGDLGVMSMYVAPGAAATLLEEAQGADLTAGGEEAYALLEDFQGLGGTVRFQDGGLELVVASDVSYLGDHGFTGEAGDAVASLPADTAFAYGLSVDGATFVEALEDLASHEGGATLEQAWSEAEAATGLSLPEDLVTLLGDSVVLAMGDDFDLDRLANSADGSDLPVGLRIEGDPAEIQSVLDKLGPRVGPQGQQLLGTDTEGDVVAVGPDPDYRAQLLQDGGLGESATFEDVVVDADSAGAVIYLDFDAGDGWLVQLAQDADADVAANLEPLSAVGMSASVDGDVQLTTLRVTTD